jgi:hypothetical protein
MNRTLLDTAPADYAGIFDRLERSLDEQLPRVAGERAKAPRLLAELLALPERQRRHAVLADRRFRGYALASHALERAGDEGVDNPCSALQLARLARLIASRTEARRGGRAAVEELCARSLEAEANLLLACGGVRLGVPEPASV